MREKIAEILSDFGISSFGFCQFDWIKEDLLDCRAKSRIPHHCTTAIMCLFPYRVREEKPKEISRYAAVDDYHEICGALLKQAADRMKEQFPDRAFEAFLDNSPIKEVKAAALCGLGVIGKNHLLITKEYGSYVFIGEILTDLKIQSVKNKNTGCINCNRCALACPTGFVENHSCKCLSEITQQKGMLTTEEIQLMQENQTMWGCDICQEVCPMNVKKKQTTIKAFLSSYRETYSPFEDITHRAYAWRGEKVIRRNYDILKNRSS